MLYHCTILPTRFQTEIETECIFSEDEVVIVLAVSSFRPFPNHENSNTKNW